MPVLSNARHERFAQAMAGGKSADEAYKLAGYKPDRGAASRMSANVSIRARVAEINGKAADRVAFTKADAMQVCIDIIQAQPDAAKGDNPLAEQKMSKAGPYYAFPCKLGALARLAKLAGWDAAEKQELGVSDPLAELLKAIASR